MIYFDDFGIPSRPKGKRYAAKFKNSCSGNY